MSAQSDQANIARSLETLQAVVQHLLQSVASLEEWRASLEDKQSKGSASASEELSMPTAVERYAKKWHTISAEMDNEVQQMELRVASAKQREAGVALRFQQWLTESRRV